MNKYLLIVIFFVTTSCKDNFITNHINNNEIADLKKSLEGSIIADNCNKIKVISVDIDPSDIKSDLSGQDIKGVMRIGNIDTYMDRYFSIKVELSEKSKPLIYLDKETDESINRRLNNFINNKWLTLYDPSGKRVDFKMLSNGNLAVRLKDSDYEGTYSFSNIKQENVESHINMEQITCENLRINLDTHSPVFYGGLIIRWRSNGDDHTIDTDFKTSSEGILLTSGKARNDTNGEVLQVYDWKLLFN